MNTPETKLTVETNASAYHPDSLLSFNHANREVLRITHEGRMICGEGLSTEEATQVAAKLLIAAFEEQVRTMVDNRLAADTVRMDWLEKESPEDWGIWSIDRATIDKAMKEGIK